MAKKYVYLFKEGNAKMRNLLGGKGANLAEMTSIGLPVPRGFTVTTEACIKYYDDGEMISYRTIHAKDGIITNLVKVTATSKDAYTNRLIQEVNEIYDKIQNIVPTI